MLLTFSTLTIVALDRIGIGPNLGFPSDTMENSTEYFPHRGQHRARGNRDYTPQRSRVRRFLHHGTNTGRI